MEHLLHFDRTAVIPCNLHCFMAIMQKLLHLLAVDVDGHTATEKELERTLQTTCKIKVSACCSNGNYHCQADLQRKEDAEKHTGTLLCMCEALKVLLTRLPADTWESGQPVWHFMCSYYMHGAATKDDQSQADVGSVSWPCQPDNAGSCLHHWRAMVGYGLCLGNCLYCQLLCWGGHTLHSCVCLSSWLFYGMVSGCHHGHQNLPSNNSYCSVECFANYAHEGKHWQNKQNLWASNGFWFGYTGAAWQQLQCGLRQEDQAYENQKAQRTARQETPYRLTKQRREVNNWSTRYLALCPQLCHFVVDPSGDPHLALSGSSETRPLGDVTHNQDNAAII